MSVMMWRIIIVMCYRISNLKFKISKQCLMFEFLNVENSFEIKNWRI